MTSPSRRSRRLERGARVLLWTYTSAAALALLLWLLLRWDAHRPTWLELVVGLFNVPLFGSLVSFVVLALITRALIGRKRVGLMTMLASPTTLARPFGLGAGDEHRNRMTSLEGRSRGATARSSSLSSVPGNHRK